MQIKKLVEKLKNVPVCRTGRRWEASPCRPEEICACLPTPVGAYGWKNWKKSMGRGRRNEIVPVFETE